MKQQILISIVGYIYKNYDDIDDHWNLLVHLYRAELRSYGIV